MDNFSNKMKKWLKRYTKMHARWICGNGRKMEIINSDEDSQVERQVLISKNSMLKWRFMEDLNFITSCQVNNMPKVTTLNCSSYIQYHKANVNKDNVLIAGNRARNHKKLQFSSNTFTTSMCISMDMQVVLRSLIE